MYFTVICKALKVSEFCKLQNIHTLPCTLHASCSQFELTILKIRESSARALFQYNCIPVAQFLNACERRVWLIHLLHGYQYFVGNI